MCMWSYVLCVAVEVIINHKFILIVLTEITLSEMYIVLKFGNTY